MRTTRHLMVLGTTVLLACGSSRPDATPAQGGGVHAKGGKGAAPGATPGATFGDPTADSASTAKTCARPSDCDDANDCTSDSCVGATGGEIPSGQCAYAAVSSAACGEETADAGAGEDAPCTDPAHMDDPSCVLQPVDPQCASGNGGPAVYPPFVPLFAPDVPASCANGFELNNPNATDLYTIHAKIAAGAPAITLDVDFASYMVPDGIIITGTDARGGSYTLLDTCRLQTWDSADPTDGMSRPPDETIRQFHIAVVEGTSSLTFDFSRVTSPTYLKVLGLCAFDVQPFAAVPSWRADP